ncbi:unnamed protein product [Hymenolepis diminuta]|uniref:Uncharacterized protein n=1 Tax=Hymenolepis diminuta TaxID=6216 RepID=A0A564Z8R6_HYMDI|nr:unnamed protein product [Hymenolepis diminuta]
MSKGASFGYSPVSLKSTSVPLNNNAHLSITCSYASCSSPLFLNTLPSLSLSLTRLKIVVASLNTF